MLLQETNELLPEISILNIRSLPSFTNQFQALSKLNIKAHIQAQNEEFESVVQNLIESNKLPILVQHIITVETWKINVLPLLKTEDGLRIYFTLYHEATAVNLLELALDKKEAIEQIKTVVIDLVDYCNRRIQLLNLWFQHP